MSIQEWEELKRKNPEKYIKKYMDFMSGKVHKCDRCPENRAWDDKRCRPCGQFHCWALAYKD